MQTDRPQRRVIVVLGAPRSGAGLLGTMLATLGVAVSPGKAVAGLGAEVVAALGGSPDESGFWLAPGATPSASRALLADWLAGEWGERAVAALATDLAGGGPVVLTYPALTALLPLWRAAFDRSGLAPTWLLHLRHPSAVARSLERRDGVPARRGHLAWQAAIVGALEVDAPLIVTQHEEVVAAPAAAMAALAAQLGMAVPGGAPERQRALVDRGRASPLGQDDPLLPVQSRQAWRLAAQWATTSAEERAQRLAGLRSRLDDAVLLTGGGRIVPALAAAADPPEAPKRIVIVHYHLFKNAGSSVDEMLRQNFGTGWGEREFEAKGGVNAPAIAAHLREHPQLSVLSSHSALLPAPVLPDAQVFPILFVRHPLLRLKSAYSFERKQKADTFGARLARGTDLCGYLDELLEVGGNRQARNFQTYRLSLGQPRDARTERERALATLAALPFVGLVEAYDGSLARLEGTLRPLIPAFRSVSVRRNATATHVGLPVAAQLDALREELGAARFDRLLAANADDVAVFDAVAASYALPVA